MRHPQAPPTIYTVAEHRKLINSTQSFCGSHLADSESHSLMCLHALQACLQLSIMLQVGHLRTKSLCRGQGCPPQICPDLYLSRGKQITHTLPFPFWLSLFIIAIDSLCPSTLLGLAAQYLHAFFRHAVQSCLMHGQQRDRQQRGVHWLRKVVPILAVSKNAELLLDDARKHSQSRMTERRQTMNARLVALVKQHRHSRICCAGCGKACACCANSCRRRSRRLLHSASAACTVWFQ